jgi:hypothetical protein
MDGVGGIDGGRGWLGQDGARNVADAGKSAQQLIARKIGIAQSTRAWGPLHTLFPLACLRTSPERGWSC